MLIPTCVGTGRVFLAVIKKNRFIPATRGTAPGRMRIYAILRFIPATRGTVSYPEKADYLLRFIPATRGTGPMDPWPRCLAPVHPRYAGNSVTLILYGASSSVHPRLRNNLSVKVIR